MGESTKISFETVFLVKDSTSDNLIGPLTNITLGNWDFLKSTEDQKRVFTRVDNYPFVEVNDLYYSVDENLDLVCEFYKNPSKHRNDEDLFVTQLDSDISPVEDEHVEFQNEEVNTVVPDTQQTDNGYLSTNPRVISPQNPNGQRQPSEPQLYTPIPVMLVPFPLTSEQSSHILQLPPLSANQGIQQLPQWSMPLAPMNPQCYQFGLPLVNPPNIQ
ncbi:hypothetical protein EIN_143180 [Entamoeba invadens IP1]|uniref:Uncharacterized protein n=1 Tax=Entamoeba invadens IP1 TaxID=370355 RepID=A0A0A1UCS5_ENTIV|nr:hypothetical protein EIN_143180 [Entamoeba invadens IP1]ELP91468.1 hypothetical protein EIN_143180 [Entamoeba invadens IP1]|eukprot:XP_004258239.1 hypothetical protein EIN_143180 [Entamoeba invadens IP1]